MMTVLTKTRLTVLLAAALIICPVGQAWASSITVGDVNSGESNTFPFGGLLSAFGGTEYQQVYNASLFGSGLQEITSITFYGAAPLWGWPNEDANGTFTMSLSTTQSAVGALDPTMANNVGADAQTFFSGALPSFPGTGNDLTFTFATPFFYNPSAGNLLLNVQMANVTNDSLALFVAQDGDFGDLSSRMINGDTGGFAGWGLVTTFDPVAPVPEPVSASLVGLGLAGGLLRRRLARR